MFDVIGVPPLESSISIPKDPAVLYLRILC